MKLIENIKIVLSLIDEYAPDSTELFTEDEDIQNKIKNLYNQPYQELSQLKKIKKIKNINKTTSTEEHYTAYSLPSDMYQLKSVIALDNYSNRPIDGDFYIIETENKIYINDASDATYKIEYYAYPTFINENTNDNFYLELNQDVQNILPYKVVDNLLKSDPSADYTAFKQAYEEAINKLDTRTMLPSITISGGYDI